MGYLSHRVDPTQIKPGDHIYTWRTAFAYSHHGIYVGENKVVHFNAQDDASSGSVWNLSSAFPSSCKNLSTSCLNSHDCEFSQPKSGEDTTSGSRLCSYCLSSSQNAPASCINIPDCGFRKQGSGVILSCLNCFIGNGSLYLFQYGVKTFVYVSKLRGGTCTTAESDPSQEVIDRAMYLLQNGFGKYDVVRNNCEDFALYCKTGLLICGKPATGSSGQVNFVSNAPWKVIVSSTLGKFVCGPTAAVAITAGMHCWDRYKTDIGVRDDVVKVKVEDVVFIRQPEAFNNER